MIRTERKDKTGDEKYETECWSKRRGYHPDDAFNQELEDSDLVNRVRQEQMRTMKRDSTINKYESKIVYTLPDNDENEEEEENSKDLQKRIDYEDGKE